ncbi:MAG: hypothetical protein AW12_03079 [Candidatus Accumulibacter sp. BA-94]|nr:MAG: hypothetical protein AW12_03079 [Candidatus Accumulibacter sp. BA-94]
MLATAAEVVRGEGTRLTQGQQPIDTLALGVAANFVVKLAAHVTDFTHVAEHQNGLADRRRKYVDARAHRVRVGIVGVVEQHRLLQRGPPLQPPLEPTKSAQASVNRGQRHTGRQARGGGGQGVACIVLPRHGQDDVHLAFGSAHGQPALETVQIEPAGDIGRLVETESAHPQAATLATPQVCPEVVGVEDSHAVFVETAVDAALFGGNRLQRTHPLQMRPLGIGHHGDAGASDSGQIGDLARMIHPHLDDRGAMRRVQLEQGERQTDVVVEVALGGQHRAVESDLQDARDHLLGGGLAIAAGHRQQRQREAIAPVGRQRTQRQAGLGNPKQGQTSDQQAIGAVCRHHRGSGATRHRRGEVVVAVEMLAAQGDEQLARGNCPTVGRHAAEGHIPAGELAGRRTCSRHEIHHDRHSATSRRAASAAAAFATSENGRRTPAIS